MTAPPPPTGFRPSLVRALPRVTGAALGLGLAVVADHFVLAGLGCLVFLVSVGTKPATCWHYVRTGTKPVSPPAAEYTEAASSARRVRERLERAGATATVAAAGDGPPDPDGTSGRV